MSTSQQIPSNDSIYGIQVYRTFVPVCSLSTLQAFIPFLYIIPTVIVMITILIKYKIAKATTNTIMDRNIFAFIMFYFLFNTLFFVGDYAHLNLPSAGFITSWCVDVKPNRLFSLIITYTHASSYGVLICPFMICLMRLTIMMSPRHHERYCQLIMYRFAIPFLFLAPFALSIFNITGVGFCKQLDEPFSFGSLILFEGEQYAKINSVIQLIFSSSIFFFNFSMSAFMFYKLRRTQAESVSVRTRELTRKAEFSLFLAVASSVVPIITNSICSITFLFNRPYWYHVLFLRPIGNDYETVMMPWVLYLTHPMFGPKKQQLKPSGASSVFVSTCLNQRKKSLT